MIQDSRVHPGKQYADDLWIRSKNHEKALHAYLEQQAKAYSRIKNVLIMELLGNMKSRRFLDYGCGPGMFLGHACKSGASLAVGIDIEEAVLSTARYFMNQQAIADECRFLVCNQFPAFSSESSFDAILLKDVIEHVQDDQSLLNAAAKAIASNGFVIVSTQNALSLNFLIEGTYQRIIRGKKDWYGWDPTHLRFYTPQTLKRKLEMAGLRCIDWRSIYLIPHKFPTPRASGRRFYRLESIACWVVFSPGTVLDGISLSKRLKIDRYQVNRKINNRKDSAWENWKRFLKSFRTCRPENIPTTSCP